MKLEARVLVFEEVRKNCVGICSVVMDDSYVVHDIRIMTGEKGLWVAMPNKFNMKKNEYEDKFHPITSAARKELFDCVLDAYKAKTL